MIHRGSAFALALVFTLLALPQRADAQWVDLRLQITSGSVTATASGGFPFTMPLGSAVLPSTCTPGISPTDDFWIDIRVFEDGVGQGSDRPAFLVCDGETECPRDPNNPAPTSAVADPNRVQEDGVLRVTVLGSNLPVACVPDPNTPNNDNILLLGSQCGSSIICDGAYEDSGNGVFGEDAIAATVGNGTTNPFMQVTDLRDPNQEARKGALRLNLPLLAQQIINGDPNAVPLVFPLDLDLTTGFAQGTNRGTADPNFPIDPNAIDPNLIITFPDASITDPNDPFVRRDGSPLDLADPNSMDLVGVANALPNPIPLTDPNQFNFWWDTIMILDLEIKTTVLNDPNGPGLAARMNALLPDLDGDGTPNAVDPDDDADGVNDDDIAPGVGTVADGPAGWLDTTCPGSANTDVGECLGANWEVDYQASVCGGAPAEQVSSTNFRDPNSDGDGIPDGTEDSSLDGCTQAAESDGSLTDTDGDGLADNAEPDVPGRLNDGDTDGLINARDTDSDNDTLLDAAEQVGATICSTDFDTDGTQNMEDTDSDGDGLLDSAEIDALLDTDGDASTCANFLDTDSDGDTVGDNTEQTACNTDPDGDSAQNMVDADSDGDQLCDGAPVTGTLAGSCQSEEIDNITDTDGDGCQNFVDTDSDGDVLADDVEQLMVCSTDGDVDGAQNMVDVDSDGDTLCDSGPVTGLLMGDCAPVEVDPTLDTDGDACQNFLDADSDGDTIADGAEQLMVCNLDPDGDGAQNMVDVDSDGDVLCDNGPVTGTLAGGCTPVEIDPFLDTDADTCVNFLDADSDGDSLADGAEQLGVCDTDLDGDGAQNMVDLDSDGDAVADFSEVSPLVDTDTDGCQNFLDVDSDGDTICDGSVVFGAVCAVIDTRDNCQLDANVTQANADGDDYGDACDDCIYEVNNNQPPFFTGTIGAECTCGDVASAGGGAPDGNVDGDDLAAMRNDVAGLAPLTGLAAEKCSIDGPPGPCNALHIAVLTRALDPNTAGPTQQACRPAICLAVTGSNFDGDCLADPNDSCPTVPDFEPAVDTDTDGVSDACDTCQLVGNPPVDPNTIQAWMTLVSGQRDDDGDGVGNRCDFKYTGNTAPLIGMEDTDDMAASQGQQISDPNGPTCALTMDQLCAQYDHDEVNPTVDANDQALLLLQVGMPNGTDCGTACTPAFSDPNAPRLNHVLCSGPQCTLLP